MWMFKLDEAARYRTLRTPTRTTALFLLPALGLLAGVGCSHEEPLKTLAAPVTPTVGTTLASLHTIVLPHDEPAFPPGAGRETFVVACVVCHSPRYVTMQPPFPHKVWLSEVKKMKKTFGAHITDAQVQEITGYLVQIDGKPDKTEEGKKP